ncbi:2-oxo acid dehydrogenase subunit E2, partial [Flavobacteriaceae bacterium]|nr:2-oxo acid dehydrogenase subunit E2 [Flavobacteriaceae bacterium]
FESFYDGVLLHIGIDEGSTAPVDSIIAIIGSKGEDISEIINNDIPVAKEEPTPVVKEEPTPVVKEEPTPVVKEEPTPVAKEQVKPVSIISMSNDRILISPLAKKLADEKGIDISAIKGSGDSGRIIKRDIDSFKPSNYSQFSQPRPHLKESSYETQNSAMRKAIAKRLSDSKFSAPHYYLNIELEMDNIISFRKQFIQTQNIKISFNDIIAKAVSLSLAKHPKVNSRWYDDKIIFNEHVHLGVAVAVDDGLVVPVVKFSNSKDLPQINTEIKDFAERAKNKKLSPSEIEGSTFTISNLGMFGIESFTSIINQPNSAILSIGAIVQKPIVKNNEVVVGNTMKLTLACDHRTVDGATGSLFLKTLKEYIENPVSILI